VAFFFRDGLSPIPPVSLNVLDTISYSKTSFYEIMYVSKDRCPGPSLPPFSRSALFYLFSTGPSKHALRKERLFTLPITPAAVSYVHVSSVLYDAPQIGLDLREN